MGQDLKEKRVRKRKRVLLKPLHLMSTETGVIVYARIYAVYTIDKDRRVRHRLD